MLISYFNLAIRLLIRNPFFTIINVLSLSIGFTVFFVLWQYSEAELGADQFYNDADRIYRFGNVFKWENAQTGWQKTKNGIIHPEIVRQVAENFPPVEDFTRVFNNRFFSKRIMNHGKHFAISYLDQRGEKIFFREKGLVYADPNFFTFFGLPVVSGNPSQFLNDPNTAVVSETFAENYFKNEDVIGKTLFINDSIPLRITGIFKNLPKNTHLAFEIAASTVLIKKKIEVRESTAPAHSYYKIKAGTDIAQLQNAFNLYFKQNWNHLLDNSIKIDYELYLQPLAEVPFTQFGGDTYSFRSKQTLLLLNIIAWVILLMAWINYINLTISAHAKRIKELAARKTVGALSSDFTKQFLLESTVINVLALLVSITLIQVIRYPLEVYLHFYIPYWNEISFSTGVILSIVAAMGIALTAFYPALVTLKRAPKMLVGSIKIRKNETLLGKTLTTIQFASSIILIIWTSSVFRQIDFILSADMGINQTNVVVVDVPVRSGNSGNTLDSFLQRISSLPGLKGFTTSTTVIGDKDWGWANFEFPETNLQYGAGLNGGVDENFIPFYDLKLIAGRNFLPDHPADRNAIIVSEILIDKLGIPGAEKAIGKKVRILVNQQAKEWKTCEIIGVLEGYRVRSLFFRHGHTTESTAGNDRDHLALTYKEYLLPYLRANKISLRIEPYFLKKTISDIENIYTENFPADVFNWYFLDKHIDSDYDYEKVARNQLLLFTALAILISCLGLLGMINNKAIEKTKEIGIRKLLGAKLLHIYSILLNTSTRLVLVSTAIGIPLAKYLTDQYLEKFEKQIPFNIWYFTLPMVILLVIMLLTVSSAVLKAAKTNPVESLKYE